MLNSSFEEPSGFFFAMATFHSYTKPPLSSANLIAKLIQNGMTVVDQAAAENFLDQISYFRLKSYLHIYIDHSTKRFHPGTTFEKVVEIYHFDQGLRSLLFSKIGDAEVYFRSTINSTMAHAAGHGFWYLEDKWFNNRKIPNQTIKKLSAQFQESKDVYSEHYRNKYYNDKSGTYKNLPPFWLICEHATLGAVLEISKSIDQKSSSFHQTGTSNIPNNSVLDKMSINKFGAQNYKSLITWIHLLRDVRNNCAHHGRVWNSNFPAPSEITAKTPIIQPNRIYSTFVVLNSIFKKKGGAQDLKQGLLSLIATSTESANNLQAMGIPVNWDQATFWN